MSWPLRRLLRLRCHGLSSACGSGKVFGRIWHGQNSLIFMRFHVVSSETSMKSDRNSTTEKSGAYRAEAIYPRPPVLQRL